MVVTYDKQEPHRSPHKRSIFGMMLDDNVANHCIVVDMVDNFAKCRSPRVARSLYFAANGVCRRMKIGEYPL